MASRQSIARTLLPLLLVAASGGPLGAQLSREQAVAALLDPGSGVTFDTAAALVWSPVEDFGFGPDHLGLLPQGSVVEPAEEGFLPFAGPGRTLTDDRYLFWIDDAPWERMQHPTRFVFVSAQIGPAPTVGNGGILVDQHGWWPLVTWGGGLDVPYFEHAIQRTSDAPPGHANPDGLIAGSAPSPADFVMPPDPPPLASDPAPGNPCALLLRGSGAPTGPDNFRADMLRYETDLKTLYGVPGARIVKAAGGLPATWADFCNAIAAVKGLSPPCDKIYVRMVSHGNSGRFFFKDGSQPASFVCKKLRELADLGVPICLTIDACRSASLLDPHNWNFPKGSSIVVSTAAGRTCAEGPYNIAGAGKVLGGAFSIGMSRCANDTTDLDGDLVKDADLNADGVIDDIEAFLWMRTQKPCYEIAAFGGLFNYYPAGKAGGTPGDINDPGPSFRRVPTDPKKYTLHVKKGAGADKTDIHMAFAGDVSTAVGKAWRSDLHGTKGAPWADGAGETTVTYDPQAGETVVEWLDVGSPITAGDWMLFTVCLPKGGLKFLRFWATPTAVPVADPDKGPTLEGRSGLEEEGTSARIALVSRGTEAGGWGQDVQASLAVRRSPYDIPGDNFFPADGLVAGLPRVPITSLAVPADEPQEFFLGVPSTLALSDHLLMEAEFSWALNDFEGTSWMLFEPLGAPAWTRLGDPLPGTPGLVSDHLDLLGAGPLTPGSANGVQVVNGPAFAPGFLLLSPSVLLVPFKGGVLVPAPDVILPHGLDAAGRWVLPFSWPGGFPSGVPFYLQEWLVDPGGPAGFAASNGLQGVSG